MGTASVYTGIKYPPGPLDNMWKIAKLQSFYSYFNVVGGFFSENVTGET